LDFRVQAIAGSRLMVDPHSPNHILAFGSESDWSPIQTVTIPASNNSSPSPTGAPTVPEFYWLAIIPLMVTMFSIALLIRHRKTAKLNQ
jgi:hypothetical protein